LISKQKSVDNITLPSNPALVVLWREIHIPLFIDLYFFFRIPSKKKVNIYKL
jgi:hypothetical protein